MKITEKQIEDIWLHNKFSEVLTTSGDICNVIFPGRISTDGGCDFHDAVFSINDIVKSGDIEVHINKSSWYRHNHHKDPKYNAVSLHVVLCDDNGGLPTILENGNSIPTICLRLENSGIERHFVRDMPDDYRCQAVLCRNSSNRLLDLVAYAGKLWFMAKVELFKKKMDNNLEIQLLYTYIARALGFSKNADIFQKLANNLTIQTIRPIILEDINTAKALVLGTSGLLPSQRIIHKVNVIDNEARLLELKWRMLNMRNLIKEEEWYLFRIRPGNSPVRRLIALIYIAQKMMETDFIDTIITTINMCAMKKNYGKLEDLMIIFPDSYWLKHIDFNKPLTQELALIGYSRARTILINVILPFIFAYADLYNDNELKSNIQKIFENFNKLESNQISRYMEKQLLNNNMKLKAIHQQGMMYIYKEYCKYRNCTQCLINSPRYAYWVLHPV